MKIPSVPNAVLLVMDPRHGVIPDSMNGGLIAASESCIAIGTIAESECEVEIEIRHLTQDDQPGDPSLQCAYRAYIATPQGILSVCSVWLAQLVTAQVSRETSLVEVWLNDDSEPNRVIVVVREDITRSSGPATQ